MASPNCIIFGDESVPEASDLFCLRPKQGPLHKRTKLRLDSVKKAPTALRRGFPIATYVCLAHQFCCPGGVVTPGKGQTPLVNFRARKPLS